MQEYLQDRIFNSKLDISAIPTAYLCYIQDHARDRIIIYGGRKPGQDCPRSVPVFLLL